MKIDTEKDQQLLSLLYSLQNNNSNATLTPWRVANAIEKRKVYKAFNWDIKKYVYSLEPISDHQKRQKKASFKKAIGGRPQILSQQDKENIDQWKAAGTSNRQIAKMLKVSEGTIRKYLKTAPPLS